MDFKQGVAMAVLAACVLPAAGQSEFLVTDYDSNKVVRYEWPSYQPVDHFVGSGLSPLDKSGSISIGPNGNLYVASMDDNEVLQYDGGTGKYLGKFVTGLSNPYQILWHDDVLHIANYAADTVVRYDAAGQFIDVLVGPGVGGVDGPAGLVFTDSGDLLVSSYLNDKVLRYDSAGAFKEEVALAGLGVDGPWLLTLGQDGSVYVPCRISNRVVRIDAQGVAAKFIEPAGGYPDGPIGVAIDPEGRLLVTCYDNGAVVRYDAEFGQLIGPVVTPGSGGVGAPFGIHFLPPSDDCLADFDGNGVLDLFDFLAFVNVFNAGC